MHHAALTASHRHVILPRTANLSYFSVEEFAVIYKSQHVVSKQTGQGILRSVRSLITLTKTITARVSNNYHEHPLCMLNRASLLLLGAQGIAVVSLA